jgi:hypothetical protein
MTPSACARSARATSRRSDRDDRDQLTDGTFTIENGAGRDARLGPPKATPDLDRTLRAARASARWRRARLEALTATASGSSSTPGQACRQAASRRFRVTEGATSIAEDSARRQLLVRGAGAVRTSCASGPVKPLESAGSPPVQPGTVGSSRASRSRCVELAVRDVARSGANSSQLRGRAPVVASTGPLAWAAGEPHAAGSRA